MIPALLRGAEEYQDAARWAQLAQIAQQVTIPEDKAEALSEIAALGARIANAKGDMTLWAQALEIAEGIEAPEAQAWALSEIAANLAMNAETKQDTALWARALDLALRIKEPAAYDRTELDERARLSSRYTSGSVTDHRSGALSRVAQTAASMAENKYDPYLLSASAANREQPQRF
ncbi:MAG: hypothetical protein ACREYF_13765 [Gammaproteobacteria bacterium]